MASLSGNGRSFFPTERAVRVLRRLFLTLAIFVVAGRACAAYTPPLGIPAPSFGMNESAPAQPAGWPSTEVPGYYYVDNTDPAATDTANPYGYPARPRLTLPNHVTFTPGSVVEIHGGPYAGTTVMSFQCTVTAPCWVRGHDVSTRPVFTGLLDIRDAHYVVFENLDFNGGVGEAMSLSGMDTAFVAIRDSVFQNRTWVHNTSAIGLLPKVGGTLHDVTIARNSFHDLGDWLTKIDQDFHGITPSLWGKDATTSEYRIWILGNEFYHLSGNGVQVNAGNWTDSYKYLHHIYIGGNVGHDNRQAAFWSKQASDVIISQNKAYGGRLHGLQPGDGIGFQYGPENIWVIFNEIYDSNFGIRQSDTTAATPLHKAYIIGNWIHDINHEPVAPGGKPYDPNYHWRQGVGITFWSAGMERYVVDNTLTRVESGINEIQPAPLTISGNLIATTGGGHQVSGFLSARAGLVHLDHNAFHDDTSNTLDIRWDGTEYVSLNTFSASVGECTQGCRYVADPLFVSSTGPAIRQNSPVVDQGLGATGNSVYDIFYNLYGIDIRKDYLGNPRPRGKAWDIGAVEYPFLPPLSPPTMTLSCCQ